MKVKVIAPVDITCLDGEGCLEIPSGSRVRDVIRKTGFRWGMILPVSVNGQQVGRSHILKEGDIIVFVFPMSGG